jgi:hypothetical protein
VPDRRRHLSKAEQNETLSLSLQGGGHNDWAVTLLFYAALHLVDAYLDPMQPKRHTDRRNLIRNDPVLRPIWFHYRELDDRSRDARYECLPFSGIQVSDLRSNSFEPVKRHLRRLLNL